MIWKYLSDVNRFQSRPPTASIAHLDEVREVKGRFLDAPLALEVRPLVAPVSRHRHRVTGRLRGGEGGGRENEVRKK